MKCLRTSAVVCAAGLMALAGGVVQGRGGAPLPVPASGLRIWLDASDAASFTFDNAAPGQSVAAWASRAPATEVLTQATKSKQPVRSLLPGFTCVQFDGADDVLLRTVAGPVDVAEPTIFMVIAPLSNVGNNQYHAFLSWTQGTQNDYDVGINVDMGGTGSSTFETFNMEGAKLRIPGGSDFMTTGLPFAVPTIVQGNYWNSTIIASINGVAQRAALTPANQNPVAFDTVRLGARYYGGSERGYCNVRVAEVLVYDRTLNACEINTVGQYLSGKYGITASYLRPDLNGDGIVNTIDLAKLLGAFGTSVTPFTSGDVNGDGLVNTIDLALLLSSFGLSC